MFTYQRCHTGPASAILADNVLIRNTSYTLKCPQGYVFQKLEDEKGIVLYQFNIHNHSKNVIRSNVTYGANLGNTDTIRGCLCITSTAARVRFVAVNIAGDIKKSELFYVASSASNAVVLAKKLGGAATNLKWMTPRARKNKGVNLPLQREYIAAAALVKLMQDNEETYLKTLVKLNF